MKPLIIWWKRTVEANQFDQTNASPRHFGHLLNHWDVPERPLVLLAGHIHPPKRKDYRSQMFTSMYFTTTNKQPKSTSISYWPSGPSAFSLLALTQPNSNQGARKKFLPAMERKRYGSLGAKWNGGLFRIKRSLENGSQSFGGSEVLFGLWPNLQANDD